ncbi:MAG: DsbA family protein, partial [Roseicyclus sp.]
YPVFGARSEAAARVIRAAGTLGRAEEMRRHLQTRPSPDTAPGVAALAARMGLDQDALAAAWASEEVAARLREDRGLARLLGLPGTPGLVVGRTLVIGAPPRARLAALLALEEAAGAPAACAGM